MIQVLLIPLLIIVVIFLFTSIKIINEYERGVKFTFGIYTSMMTPGLNLVIPIIQSYDKVDIRTKVIDVPEQDAMTKDNVSVNINAVIYYRIDKAELAILEIENFHYAVSQIAQITMKNTVGVVSLDELLSNRDMVSQKIKDVVDKATDPWGIKVDGVDLKHIELPADMKRVMAREAEAEREKRAVIIKAEGEVSAAMNIAKAAHALANTPGALHLRTLHSINDLSSDKSNTTIYAIPSELLRLVKSWSK
jgi:regulator of protease activity HflC (stomatin/prohibitin superfamily)